MIKLSDELLADINALAEQAGQAIMEIYNAPDFAEKAQVERKGDDSPLTSADIKSHQILSDGINNLSNGTEPAFSVLSEESAHIPWHERQTWQTYWLIDPLDGTKEFIKQNGEFTVNIALIHNGEPILGSVYAPALKTSYTAAKGLGAFKNGKPIQARQNAHHDTLKIVGSRSHPSPDMQAYLDQLNKPYEMVPMGSSLKFCLIAESEAHIYPRLGPTSEWDTAAAHAVVEAAGGSVTQVNGAPLRYNQKESLLNPHFIAR